MAYSDLLSKRGQDVGYRVRISGVKYYWVSHPEVPQLSDSAGGTDYTRVEGAFLGAPKALPEKAFPFDRPEVLTTDVELIDIDGALTDIWSTERVGPATVLQSALDSGDTASMTVEILSTANGLAAFDSSGFCYIDSETIEYSSVNVLGQSIDTLIRGKFAEGFESTDVDHARYLLASSILPRPVYGYLPHLWYREVMVEVFDLENISNTSVIARGFLSEPGWVGEEIFRFRILNYIHPLRRQINKRTECKGELAIEWNLQGGLPDVPDRTRTVTSYTLTANVSGTQEIADADAFFENTDLTAYQNLYLPERVGYILVGGDDGEIMAYSDWDADSTEGEFTIVCRGCFGTKIGKDNSGIWEKGTPFQHISAVAGATTFYKLKQSTGMLNWQENLIIDVYGDAEYIGVNPINAFLMWATSISGDQTNGDYDVLPSFYGLGISENRIDLDAFANFKQNKCTDQQRQFIYLEKNPSSLLDMVVSDIQVLYGGMVYATREGQITIAELRQKVPGDTVTTVGADDIVDFVNIGVQEVHNTLKYTLDQWPSQKETVINAYDHRRRDAMGEAPADDVSSKGLRGLHFRSWKTFNGESVVVNQVTDHLYLLGNGAPVVEMTLTPKHMDLSPGDFIAFTHSAPPKITSNARGFSSQSAIVLESAPDDEEAQTRIKAMLLRQQNTCLWCPSAEIATRTDDTDFTITAAVFNANDRQDAFWDNGAKIRVWNVAMTAFDSCTIESWTSSTGRIVLTGAGSSNVVVGNRITWDAWDTVRGVGSGVTQYARSVSEEYYGYFAGSDETLGTGSDPARVWL